MTDCKCENGNLFVPALATITDKVELTATETFFRFELQDGSPLGHTPGQFVELSMFGYGEAPISISSPPDQTDSFEMCVRKLGTVTTALHGAGPGASVGIRGPFGRGFPVDRLKGRDVLIIGGGLGLIPLRSLIKHVLANRDSFRSVTILNGAKSPAELLFKDECAEWQQREDVVYLETVDRGDSGWGGHVGVITTLIPKLEIDPRRTLAAICGPPIMYRFVILDLLAAGMAEDDLLLSLERRMKCGVGKCGHCQMNSKYVCLDGPVFSYHEIKRLTEAL
jgi:NAD(P)H-flavin reductase